MSTGRSHCHFYGRGCKRTAGAGMDGEWVCGRHWRLAPRRLIRLHLEVKRLLRKIMRRWPDSERLPKRRLRLAILAVDRERRRWDAIKAAIARALDEGAEVRMKTTRRQDLEAPPRVQRGFEAEFQRLKKAQPPPGGRG